MKVPKKNFHMKINNEMSVKVTPAVAIQLEKIPT